MLIGCAGAMNGPYAVASTVPEVPDMSWVLDMDAANATIVDSGGTPVVTSVSDTSGFCTISQGANPDYARPIYRASEATLNGEPAIEFSASHLLSVTGLATGSTDYTVFAVYNQTALTGPYQYLLDIQSPRTICEAVTTSGNIGFYKSTHTGIGSAAILGPQVVAWRFTHSAATCEVFRNNRLLGSQAFTTSAPSGIAGIGSSYASAGSQPLRAYLSRLLIAPAALTNENLGLVKAKLLDRFLDWEAIAFEPPTTNLVSFINLTPGAITMGDGDQVAAVAGDTGPGFSQAVDTQRPDLVRTAPGARRALHFGSDASASGSPVMLYDAAISATPGPWTMHFMANVQSVVGYLFVVSSGILVIRLTAGRVMEFSTNGSVYTSVGGAISVGWHLLTLTLQEGTNTVTLHVDGVLHGTASGYTNRALGGTVSAGATSGGSFSYNAEMLPPLLYSGVQDSTARGAVTSAHNVYFGTSYTV